MTIQRQRKQRGKSIPWKRVITVIIAILLVIAGALVWILNTEHIIQGDWTNILPVVFIALAVIIALLTWLVPFSPDQPEAPSLPLARELVREWAAFRMGDTVAANFDYINEPIESAYDTAKQALRDASIGIGAKRGTLILGKANAGKTRLALEALIKTLPDWNVLLWNAAYDTLSKVPSFTVSRGSGLVVFIDDLQEYVLPEVYMADVLGFIPDNRIATLQAFLDSMPTMEHLVVVATCRLEDETRVGAKLRWLFDQLRVIALPRFGVETTNPESAKIIGLFRQHGAIHIEDWDGTLGSLVLGLSKKRSQYEGLVQSHSPAVTVLRAMKLLSLARITTYTHLRIQGVCTGVFGEHTLQEGSKAWQDVVDQLTRLEFVTEVKDQASGLFALVIRKDAYFDEVIKDYPSPDRPYQLDQDFERLQKVFVGLNDHSALINLAFTLGELKRYEEALAAFEQAIRLPLKDASKDAKDAFAYSGKGIALGELKRYEEALAAFEQAIRLRPNLAAAYTSRGVALSKLKRHEEALAAYEQAIRLRPNDAVAYNNKGSALFELKRHEEALVAYEQAIRLDPNLAPVYNGKGSALGELKRYEEALAAFEQAIRLDPNLVLAYTLKGLALGRLKQHEEALAAYEQAIHLDPTDAVAYTTKKQILRILGQKGEA